MYALNFCVHKGRRDGENGEFISLVYFTIRLQIISHLADDWEKGNFTLHTEYQFKVKW